MLAERGGELRQLLLAEGASLEISVDAERRRVADRQRLLALGQHLNLNQAQTLALFGRFYREDVLDNPNGSDHANIRNFMKTGHEEVVFETFPLVELQN